MLGCGVADGAGGVAGAGEEARTAGGFAWARRGTNGLAKPARSMAPKEELTCGQLPGSPM
jgi:hypothetical protein